MAKSAAQKSREYRERERAAGRMEPPKFINVEALTPEQTAELLDVLGKMLQGTRYEKNGKHVPSHAIQEPDKGVY